MCTQKPPFDFSMRLYHKYKEAMDEYNSSVVRTTVYVFLEFLFSCIPHSPKHIQTTISPRKPKHIQTAISSRNSSRSAPKSLFSRDLSRFRIYNYISHTQQLGMIFHRNLCFCCLSFMLLLLPNFLLGIWGLSLHRCFSLGFLVSFSFSLEFRLLLL